MVAIDWSPVETRLRATGVLRPQASGENGGRDWDRTSDPCDVNAVLIPLSYAPDRCERLLYRE